MVLTCGMVWLVLSVIIVAAKRGDIDPAILVMTYCRCGEEASSVVTNRGCGEIGGCGGQSINRRIYLAGREKAWPGENSAADR